MIFIKMNQWKYACLKLFINFMINIYLNYFNKGLKIVIKKK